MPVGGTGSSTAPIPSTLTIGTTSFYVSETNNGCEEYNRLGGGERFKEVENLVKTANEANRKPKEVAMKAGKENAFIKSHEKNRDNANPTAIGGVPKVTKGSVNRKIMSNKEVYNEGLTNEISEIRYLIEYMNNNNKKQNL